MNKKKSTEQEFGKIRSALWPIHNDELKKFLPMGLMMFFIIFVYFVVRNTKDALVVIESGGAGIIPYLKGYLVMPCAIFFVIAYSKLLNVFDREKVFYIIVSFFTVFFGLFATVLYPNLQCLHPSKESVDAAIESVEHLGSLGHFLVPFIKMWGMWSYSAFYVIAELWGSSMIALLFWQFANQITKTVEAKRFYPMFGLMANLAPIAAGFAVKHYSAVSAHLPEGVDPWGYTINHLMFLVVLAGLATMGVYRWMQTNILTDKRFYDESEMSNQPKKKKAKLSVSESFKLIFTSKYLGLIALLVLTYGISINLVELVWKNQVKIMYTDKNQYNEFMGWFSIATGITTMLLIMFFKGVVARFGWLKGALVTPMIVLITGSLFFIFILFQEYLDPLMAMTGLSALALSVWLGAAQNVLSKGVKYSLFDPTKEMAYIPLDDESKTKGKAAVDVIGGRLGKAGGGYIASFLLPFFAGDVLSATPLIFVIVTIVLLLWIYAVYALNTRYQQKLAESEQ